MIIGVTLVEKEELTTYQIKDVFKVWFNQLNEETVGNEGPFDWRKFILLSLL